MVQTAAYKAQALRTNEIEDLKTALTPMTMAEMEQRVASVEQERVQLAMLLQISRRYLTKQKATDPIDILFSVLHRIVRFDAAFVAVPGARGTRYVSHPSGATLSPEQCRRVHRDADAKVSVALDEESDVLELGAMVVRSRALLPIDNGGTIAILSSITSLYTPAIEFLTLLAQIHSSAVLGSARDEERR